MDLGSYFKVSPIGSLPFGQMKFALKDKSRPNLIFKMPSHLKDWDNIFK
jgi:hypothetical protein